MTIGGNWKDLFNASETGDVEKLRYHLKMGVDPNYQHPEFLTAPLFEAIRNGHMEIVQILVEEGNADPSIIEDYTQDTLFETAISLREYDILNYLNTKLPKEKQWKPHHILVTNTEGRNNMEISKEISKQLLLKGHCVIFTWHDEQSAILMKKELHDATGNPNIRYIVGTLDSVKNVNAIIEKVRNEVPSLNTLIHNANLWSPKLIQNENGLEQSFMMNFMARHILNTELMPLLKKNENSRIIFVTPESKPSLPDVKETPFGKDFSRSLTVSKTITCGIMSFLNTVKNTNDSQVTVSMIQTGNVYDSIANPSYRLIHYIRRIVNAFLYDTPDIIAKNIMSILDIGEYKDLHGQFFEKGVEEPADMHAINSLLVPTLGEWEQWTTDFLLQN